MPKIEHKFDNKKSKTEYDRNENNDILQDVKRTLDIIEKKKLSNSYFSTKNSYNDLKSIYWWLSQQFDDHIFKHLEKYHDIAKLLKKFYVYNIFKMNDFIFHKNVMDLETKAVFNALYYMTTCIPTKLEEKEITLYRGMAIPSFYSTAFKRLEPSDETSIKYFIKNKPIIHPESFWGFSLDDKEARKFTLTMEERRYDSAESIDQNNYRILIENTITKNSINAMPGSFEEREFVFGPGVKFEVVSSEFVKITARTLNNIKVLLLKVKILDDLSQFDHCFLHEVEQSFKVLKSLSKKKLADIIMDEKYASEYDRNPNIIRYK